MQRKTLFLFSVVFLILVSFPLTSSVYASVGDGDQTYEATDDYAYSLIELSGGGYAIAGTNGVDFWLVTTDASGDLVWNGTYPDVGSIAYSMVETSDGGFAIAGTTSSGEDSTDFSLVKTDSSNNILWSQTYGGAYGDVARSLVATSDGGFAIAGYTDSFGAGNTDFWLVKTDSSGTEEWTQTYGGAEDDYARSLVATSDGGYAIAGDTESSGAGYADFWLVKTDSSGTEEWSQTYGSAGYDVVYSLVATSDGGYAIAGDTDSSGDDSADFWLVKTDSSGTEEWTQTYSGVDVDSARLLIATSDGGFAIAGAKRSTDNGDADFWLVKTDSSGDVEWTQTYGGVALTPESTATPEPTLTPESTATPEPTLTPESTATPEPTPIPEAAQPLWIALIAGVVIIVVVAVILVYFKKIRKTTE